jgi:DNA-binding response OmpR family regulator
MAQVLLVMQEFEQAKEVRNALRGAGLLVDCICEMTNARAAANEFYDIVIFDWTAGSRNWKQMVAQYRNAGGTAAVIGLVKPNAAYRILALEAGADDCIAKPSDDVRELNARIRALLRRPRYVAVPQQFAAPVNV